MTKLEQNCKDMADVCELAHKRTIQEIGKKLQDKWFKDMEGIKGAVCPVWGYFRDEAERLSECTHENGDIHYTEQAQDIFNEHYDYITNVTGI